MVENITNSKNNLNSVNTTIYTEVKSIPFNAPSIVDDITFESIIFEDRELRKHIADGIAMAPGIDKIFESALQKQCQLHNSVGGVLKWVGEKLEDERVNKQPYIQQFRSDLVPLLENKHSLMPVKIDSEKIEVEKYLELMKAFFDGLIFSLTKTYQEMREIQTQDPPKSVYYKPLLYALIVACVLLEICKILHTLLTKTILNIIFAAIYVTLLIVFGIFIIQFFTQLAIPDCQSKPAPTLHFNFIVPSFNNHIPTYANEIYSNCHSNQTTFLANTSPFILESSFLKDYQSVLDDRCDELRRQTETTTTSFDDILTWIQSYKTDFETILSSNCVPDNQTSIQNALEYYTTLTDKYIPVLGSLTEALENIKRITRLAIKKKMPQLMHVETVLFSSINKIIKSVDFDCTALAEVLLPKEKKCTKIEKEWLIVVSLIIIPINSILFSIDFMIKKLREKPLFKKDGDDKVANVAKKEFNTGIVKWAEDIRKTSLNDLAQQFYEFDQAAKKLADEKKKEAKTCLEHRTCNRYNNVYCLEKTRVVLKNRPEHDYIHANWVKIPGAKTPYILTQAPLKETFSDFWAMCYQEKVGYIVMVCSLHEKDDEGNPKSYRYFPEKVGNSERYGQFEVTFVEVKPHPIEAVLWKTFKIVDTNNKQSVAWLLDHVNVTWWPDRSIPEEPSVMNDFHVWLKSVNPLNRTICVHCSAGIGRTGTFVFVDYAANRLPQNLDVMKCVTEFREMRYGAVQTDDQYVYSIVCLLTHFSQMGYIDDQIARDVLAEYKKWRTTTLLQDWVKKEAFKGKQEKRKEEKKKKKLKEMGLDNPAFTV